MSDSLRACTTCGTSLSSEQLGGLCPKCLLLAGVGDQSGDQLHIRCPQCHVAIELVDELTVREVTCPSCDSRFSLVGDQTVTVAAESAIAIGRFRLIDRVGIGAFGAVWKAYDPQLDRIIAVKIPRKEQLTAAETEQFLREARAAGQLKHKGIVGVHEVGRDGDRIYIVSDFVAGVTLADSLTARQPSTRDAAKLCREVADALHHAHQQGVIHRDLKPSNIMLDNDGRPLVMDFGLAKREAAEITMTVEGRILGTPAYMSPEQARGDGHHADGRSDVYSLGVILFELLTGEKPFRGSSQMLLHQVLKEEPPSLRKLNGLVPQELETICLKCLEKDPDHRFPSAAAVAEELDRFLSGRPILSQPISRVARLARWCRRNPQVAGLVSAVAASLIVGLLATLWQWRSAQHNFESADAARTRAQKSETATRMALDESQSLLARLYVERGMQQIDIDPHAGLPWLLQALTTEPEDSPTREMHRLRIGLMLHELPKLLGYWPGATEATFSDDGRKVAICTADGGVQVFELPSMHPTPVMPHERPAYSVKFTPQGDRLATLWWPEQAPRNHLDYRDVSPPKVRVWNASTGQPETPPMELPTSEYGVRFPPKIHFSPDGERFVLTQAGMTNRWHSEMAARVFSSRTLEQAAPTFAHHSDLDYMDGYHSLSPDALRVLVPRGAAANDPNVAWSGSEFPDEANRPQQYDLMTSQPVHPPLDTEYRFYGWPRYNSDGSQIATSHDGEVTIWNAADGTLINTLRLQNDKSHADVQFHPNGSSVFLIEKTTASLRDISSGNILQEWVHDDKCQVDPTGRYSVIKSSNGHYYIDDLTQESSEQRLIPDFYRIHFCPDGSRFILRPDDGPQRILDSLDAEFAAPAWRFTGGDIQQPLSHDGRYCLSKFDEGVWLWDLDRHNALVERFPPDRTTPLIDGATSRDRRHCVTLTEDLTLSCWATETGQQNGPSITIARPSPTDQESKWESLTLSESGEHAAILGSYYEQHPASDSPREVSVIQVWDLKTGQLVFNPIELRSGNYAYVELFGFCFRDRTILIKGFVNRQSRPANNPENLPDVSRLYAFDATTGNLLGEPAEIAGNVAHNGWITGDSRCLLCIEDIRSSTTGEKSIVTRFVQIFDTRTWQPITPPMSPRDGDAHNAALSPDGRYVVFGDAEVWDAASGQRVHEALVPPGNTDQIVFENKGSAFIAVSNEGHSGYYAVRSSEIRRMTLEGEPLATPMFATPSDFPYCAFSPNDAIIAAAGKRLRLWDASQGSLLSGAIALDADFYGKGDPVHRETFFSPDGNRLYLELGEEMQTVRWRDFVEGIPVDEVVAAWAVILSGRRIDKAGGIVRLTPDEFQAAWTKVR